jgi:hypothetical protein
MNRKANYVCLLLGILSFLACKESESPKPTLGFELTDKSEAIYNVSETTYAISDEPFTSSSFVRETVVDIQRTKLETIYTIERYRRKDEAVPWRIERVYKLRQTLAELIEIGKSPEVKLTFPISENARFDKNRYNSQGESTSFYLNTNQRFGNFPVTYSVYQANDSTLINLKRIYDVYSPTDGLVYKEITDYNYCQSSPDCIGTGRISFGKQIVWKRIF